LIARLVGAWATIRRSAASAGAAVAQRSGSTTSGAQREPGQSSIRSGVVTKTGAAVDRSSSR